MNNIIEQVEKSRALWRMYLEAIRAEERAVESRKRAEESIKAAYEAKGRAYTDWRATVNALCQGIEDTEEKNAVPRR
jgi:hypothetical protein